MNLQKNSNQVEMSMKDIINNKSKFNGKEFTIVLGNQEKIYVLNTIELDNVFSKICICMFKEITEVYNLEKERAANRYKSVLMGWLTHELRTPVNWVISGLDSLEYYIVSKF